MLFNHENIHRWHFDRISLDRLKELSSETKIKEWQDNEAMQIAAAKVSGYARKDPKEFVAEVGAGLVNGQHFDKDVIDATKNDINDIIRVAEVGDTFDGEVTRVESYGVFVKLFGKTEALCHVSRLAWEYIKDAHEIVKVGDSLKVTVTEIDDKGKVAVSHREFLPRPEGYVERSKENHKGYKFKKHF